ncbi:MAG: hypothetical protein QGF53_04885, partial [Alphaproteobacteria bacterium]|nr:hypothetical protein [Alphaproteobacteria bacterium]
ETAWSVGLRESLFVWPLVEATHVLTLMLFLGTIVMVDLRLLGIAFREVRVSEMTARILPWTIAGFVLMVITGLLLFSAKPLVYYHSLFFRLKMLVLLLALVNVVLFHQRFGRRLAHWDDAARLPAALSLASWIAVVICGRMIAYDWFNCEKLRPDGVLSLLASCPG